MPREFDLRTAAAQPSVSGPAGSPLGEAGDARQASGTGVQVKKVTVTVSGEEGLTTDTGSFVSRALSFLAASGAELGLEPGQPPEFAMNPNPVQTSSGAHVVYAHQQSQSVPIFQASQTVVFSPDGAVQKTTGTVVAVPPEDIPTTPGLTAQEAVLRALNFLAEQVASTPDSFGNVFDDPGFATETLATAVVSQFPDQPDMPTSVSCSALPGNVLASLTWFPLNEALLLCWNLLVPMPQGAGLFRIIVNAADGGIVYSAQLARSATATALVYTTDPDQSRVQVSLPPAIASYGMLVPTGIPATFPYPWVADNSSAGGDVLAHSNDSDPPLAATSSGTDVNFTPADPLGMDQCTLNSFYFNCFMHDFFYLLGFSEPDGNFQVDNFGLGGAASDRVDCRVYPAPVWATANMSTPADGVSPVMKLGLVQDTGRHTALDASVVFHEATHGLTTRLIGGALDNQSLEQPQSAGMSEGWSDFVSCQLLGSTVVGAWVVNKPGGIRGFPYDAAFPGTFADLGTGRYTEMHAIGEIWCAALMAVARAIGKQRALQLMVDSVKVTPSNPAFTDARDAMFTALDHDLASGSISQLQHDSEETQMWQAFARAGLGPAASSAGATLQSVSADFQAPPASAAPPTAGWVLTGPAGTIPAAASITADGTPGGSTEIYVVGGDGHLYLATRSPAGTWAGWTQTGPAGTIPAAASITADGTPGGSTEIYVVGGDGHLYLATRSPAGTWAGWTQTGPAGTIPAAASITADGTPGGSTEIYVVGGDGHLYLATRSPAGTWAGWTQTGPAGTIPAAASITADGTPGGSTEIYVVGGDGHLYLATRSPAGTWAGWTQTGPAGTIPAAASITADGDELFAVGADGRLVSIATSSAGRRRATRRESPRLCRPPERGVHHGGSLACAARAQYQPKSGHRADHALSGASGPPWPLEADPGKAPRRASLPRETGPRDTHR